jgi:hypothetical protein
LLKLNETSCCGPDIPRQRWLRKIPFMETHRFANTAGSARGARARRRIAMLLLAALGAAAATHAADAASSPAAKPLDLSLARDAGQWTGTAFRVQQQERLEAGPGLAQEKALTIHAGQQPYGTGYEARMSREVPGGAFGAASAGPGMAGPGAQGGAGQGAAPRSGAGKGR